MLAGGRLWTTDEVEKLRAVYSDPVISKEMLIEMFPRRSLRSIYMKAWELRLGRQWSEDEVERLIRMFPDPEIHVDDLIAAFPGRGEASIKHKAGGLGLIRPQHGKGLRWAPEQQYRLTTLFPDPSVSRDDLMNLFQRSWDSVRKMAERMGLSRVENDTPEQAKFRHERAVKAGLASSSAEKKSWTNEEIALLRELYPDPKTAADDICSGLGRAWSAIKMKAKAMGLSRSRKKYEVRSDYFDVIDSDEKAYWLGFIAADGGIVGIRGLKIELAIKDADHVRAFRDIIAPNAETYDVPPKVLTSLRKEYLSSGGVGIRLSERRLVESLSRYGIVSGKSRTFLWPHELNEDFAKAFVVGYVDGDGTLCVTAENILMFSLLGTESFLDSVRERIEIWTSIAIPRPLPAWGSTHLFHLGKNGKAVLKIAEMLDDVGIGLARKRLPSLAGSE